MRPSTSKKPQKKRNPPVNIPKWDNSDNARRLKAQRDQVRRLNYNASRPVFGKRQLFKRVNNINFPDEGHEQYLRVEKPSKTLEEYHQRLRTRNLWECDSPQIKKRELGHGEHEDYRKGVGKHMNIQKMRSRTEDKPIQNDNRMIWTKKYNGYLPYTGYVDPADQIFFRKRSYL